MISCLKHMYVFLLLSLSNYLKERVLGTQKFDDNTYFRANFGKDILLYKNNTEDWDKNYFERAGLPSNEQISQALSTLCPDEWRMLSSIIASVKCVHVVAH